MDGYVAGVVPRLLAAASSEEYFARILYFQRYADSAVRTITGSDTRWVIEQLCVTNIFPGGDAIDGDQDGLTVEEELFYGTSAFDLDSDNDGFSDGDEVRIGFDPTDGVEDFPRLTAAERMAAETRVTAFTKPGWPYEI